MGRVAALTRILEMQRYCSPLPKVDTASSNCRLEYRNRTISKPTGDEADISIIQMREVEISDLQFGVELSGMCCQIRLQSCTPVDQLQPELRGARSGIDHSKHSAAPVACPCGRKGFGNKHLRCSTNPCSLNPSLLHSSSLNFSTRDNSRNRTMVPHSR